jgi:hypothetical protein
VRRRFESTEQALVGAIVVMVADHMRACTLDRVSEAGPRPTDGGPCAGSYSLGFGKH